MRRRKYNVYFGGKLVKSQGSGGGDGSVGERAGELEWGAFRYLPYGEELTATADGREKFGTYTRDSAAHGLRGSTILCGGDGEVLDGGSEHGGGPHGPEQLE